MKKEKRSAASLVKRYIFLCIGLCIMAFGVAFSIEANLGTSPISSLPYVSSLLTRVEDLENSLSVHKTLTGSNGCCALWESCW